MSTITQFNPLAAAARNGGALIDTESQRAIQEVQAAMIIAKRFPRDTKEALDRIMNACSRPSLAEQAIYTYARGGTDISGPSIRLAEAVAQQWGNLQFGIRELEQSNGASTVEAFAWDLETNTRQTKVFQVPHVRHTRQGSKELTDPRDIYENVANNGARRLRACILGVIPGDIIEEAVRQCETTLKTSADNSPETQKKMLASFTEYGVTKEQIEKRIQRRIDAITPAQVVSLKKIYASLRDGMSTVEDWFEKIDKVAGDNPLAKAAAKPKDDPQPKQPEPQAAAPEPTPEKASGDDAEEARLEAMRSLKEAIREADITEATFWPRAKKGGWMSMSTLPNELPAEALVELANHVQAIADGEKKGDEK
jgi:hypothetical protein